MLFSNLPSLRMAVAALLATASFSSMACWEQVAKKHGVNPYVLGAIAKQESRFNANAINHNANGTRDVGLMQINSIHFPMLKKYGITEEMLLDPCINMEVGAWLLRRKQEKYGNTWEAVGAYHSETDEHKKKYADQVSKQLKKVLPKDQ